MRTGNQLFDGFRITVKRRLNQLIGGANRVHDLLPAAILDGIDELLLHLTVWNPSRFHLLIIGQVSKMNQQRQHIICALERGHIVLEFCGVDLNFFAGDHIFDLIAQSIKIHPDEIFQRSIGFRGVPITLKLIAKN